RTRPAGLPPHRRDVAARGRRLARPGRSPRRPGGGRALLPGLRLALLPRKRGIGGAAAERGVVTRRRAATRPPRPPGPPPPRAGEENYALAARSPLTPSARTAAAAMPSASSPAWAYMASGLSWSWKRSGRVRVR